jgi:20S proteasome alpha/beta subunit
MTYIASFECKGGIVLCADTQETHPALGNDPDEKEYVEKLYVPGNLIFPIAVGGAGLAEPIEAFSLELFERLERKRPATVAELRRMIQESIEEVHKSDAKVSEWPAAYRTTRCIVAGKPTSDEFAIFVVTGKRVSYRKREPEIIGYATPINKAYMKRLYRPDLSMQEGVILAIYLVAQSKAIYKDVGFDTKVAVVTATGAWQEPKADIAEMEERFTKISPFVDRLLLAAPDLGITESAFDEMLQEFHEEMRMLRFDHKQIVAEQMAKGSVNWPYEKLPVGCIVFQSFDDKGKRTLSVYSDPDDPLRETRALRLGDDGVLYFKATSNIYITEKTFEHLRECQSANLKECIQHIGLDC